MNAYGCMDGWMGMDDGWMDEWMDVQIDVWMDGFFKMLGCGSSIGIVMLCCKKNNKLFT